MTALISNQARANSQCVNGNVNSVVGICVCDKDFKSRDCSMTMDQWIEESSSKWNDSKLLLVEIYLQNQYEPPNQVKLAYQMSILYHILEDYDIISNQTYDYGWSIFSKQINDVKSLKYLVLSKKLTNIITKTLDLFVKARLSLMAPKIELSSEFLEISKDLSNIILRNEFTAITKNSLFSIQTTKLYPSELSNLKISYGSNNQTVGYPTRMMSYFQNVDLRKVVSSRILMKSRDSSAMLTYETVDDNHNQKVDSSSWV